MKYYVYVLESKVNQRYYVGSTEDVDKRLEFHNSPRARWTKRYQPWVLLHIEEFETRSQAIKREYAIKRMKNIKAFFEQIDK